MDLKSLLMGIATMMAILLTFATLILYAMGKINDTGGGKGEAAMISCAVAAIACYAAAAYIATQNLSIAG